MTDSILLNSIIADSGLTITSISRKLGISREGLYKKLNNETEFKASEIVSMQKILHLTSEQREAVFFAEKVE